MFTAFHHFAPTQARQILQNAYDSRQPICIFEASSRSAPALLGAVLIPLAVLILTPAIRPLAAFQIIFTYLFPILPILIFWDGFVSQLRTYSPAELRALSNGLENASYHWETGQIKVPNMPAPVPFLIGQPLITRS